MYAIKFHTTIYIERKYKYINATIFVYTSISVK